MCHRCVEAAVVAYVSFITEAAAVALYVHRCVEAAAVVVCVHRCVEAAAVVAYVAAGVAYEHRCCRSSSSGSMCVNR